MANVKISQLPTASAVTSDDFLPIVDSGSTTTQQASFQQVLDYVTGSTFNDLTVVSLSASILYVESSIVDSTGSTKFGDTSDDTHQFTGSVYLSKDLYFLSGETMQTIHFENPGDPGGSITYDHTADQLSLFGDEAGFVLGTGGYLFNDDGFDLNFTILTAGSSFFIEGSDGNVGIGAFNAVNTPNAKLEVDGDLIANVALSGAVGSEISASSYSLSADDRGKTLIFSSSATQGITCSSGLDVGYNATFVQYGSGQLELSAAAGVTILNRQSHTKTAGTYAAASVVIISSDVYLFSGDTSA